MTRSDLAWQSKLILLLVVPATACNVVFKTGSWASRQPDVAIWVLGFSLLLALVTVQLRSATPAGSATGGILTASLMYSTVGLPPVPWHTALIPVLAVALLASVSTRLGREKKERIGAAERREGRSSAQVAANLGIAALVSSELAQAWASDHGFFAHQSAHVAIVEPLIVAGLAALAEAAADTVSSEIGQVLGGRPRMLTTLRAVDPGTDGAISVAGTLAGIVSAAIVAALGTAALAGGTRMFAISCAGGVFGLFFDSLLGATIERSGWLNNDAVNFLSTASAAAFAILLLVVLR